MIPAFPLRSTPVLRLGTALLKLDSLRPSAGLDDRALDLWDEAAVPRGGRAVAAAGSGSALAAAGWARARGVALTLVLHGRVSHEARESLRLWGARCEEAPSREAALAQAARLEAQGVRGLPPLDGLEAVPAFAKSLGGELLRDLAAAAAAPAVVIAPSSSAAALAGAAEVLRARFPGVQPVLLVPASADDELPELPAVPGLSVPGALVRKVARADAGRARRELARRHGLLAGHGSALAARLAEDWPVPAGACAVALVGAAGEREFSLDAPASQARA